MIRHHIEESADIAGGLESEAAQGGLLFLDDALAQLDAFIADVLGPR